MGTLDRMLAGIDNTKRVVGRNVSDMVDDPSLYAEKIVGALRNQNAGVVPVAAGGELTNRPLTREEIASNYIDNFAGAGITKGNVIKGQFGTSSSSPVTSALSKYTPDEIAATLAQRMATGDRFSAGGLQFTPPATGDKFKFVDIHRGNDSLVGSIPAHDPANVQSSIRAMLLEDPDLLQRLQVEMLQKLPSGI